MSVNRVCALLLFITTCLLHRTGTAEPVCSKFEYEERLLEKMVRLEHDFRLLQDKWQAAQGALKESMVQVDKHMVQFQTMADANKATLDAYNATMDNLVAYITSRADANKATLDAYNATMETIVANINSRADKQSGMQMAISTIEWSLITCIANRDGTYIS